MNAQEDPETIRAERDALQAEVRTLRRQRDAAGVVLRHLGERRIGADTACYRLRRVLGFDGLDVRRPDPPKNPNPAQSPEWDTCPICGRTDCNPMANHPG